MILYTRIEPKENETKIVRKFAWLPVWIGDDCVWLQKYFVRYKYTKRMRTIFAPHSPVLTSVGEWCDWDEIDRYY